MPSPLFDYVDGPIHPMGLSPDLPTYCKTARIDCRLKPDSVCCGGGVDPQPQPPTPPQPLKPPTGTLCNPDSYGKRFSFNFPSGKKWTLSRKDDVSARNFYCPSGLKTGTIVCPDGFDTKVPFGAKTLVDPCKGHYGDEIADIAYCTGGEALYDGKPTYWTSTARKGCKTNKEGQPKPQGYAISREEYYRAISGGTPSPVSQSCPPGQAYYGGIVAKGTRLGPGCFNPADYQAQYNQLLGIQAPEVSPSPARSQLESYYCGSWFDAMKQAQGVCYDPRNIVLPECQQVIQQDQAFFEARKKQLIGSGAIKCGTQPTFSTAPLPNPFACPPTFTLVNGKCVSSLPFAI